MVCAIHVREKGIYTNTAKGRVRGRICLDFGFLANLLLYFFRTTRYCNELYQNHRHIKLLSCIHISKKKIIRYFMFDKCTYQF